MERLVNHVNKKASGVGVIFESQILLGKRIEFWNGEPISLGGYWSIFGGAIEQGENPIVCAIRELIEETGIEVTLDKLNYIKNIYHNGTELSVYCCCLDYKPEVVLNEEHTEYIWYPLEKIEDFPYNIQDDLIECLCIYRDKRYKI